MTETTLKSKRDIRFIAIENIHPDPFQPRELADADLADTLKETGLLEVIYIEPVPDLELNCEHCGLSFAILAQASELNEDPHWMIRNGERRWTAARAAEFKLIEAQIMPKSTPAERLILQLTHNAYKPLTPVEEATAYKQILIDTGMTQVQLAKKLGKPRSVVGDRIRLASLDPVWLELVHSGKLQVSHATVLSPYSEVPTKYQEKARDSYLKLADAEGADEDPMSVDQFKWAVFEAFEEFLKPLSDVRGYTGPIVEVSRGSNAQKYAADPAIWKPRFEASLARAKQKAREERHERAVQRTPSSSVKRWIDAIGDDIPKRVDKTHNISAAKGEVLIYQEHQGWGYQHKLIPSVFLANVDRKKLVRVYGNFEQTALMTSDLAAVKLAEDAFTTQLDKMLEPDVTKLSAELKALQTSKLYSIAGAGVLALVQHYFRTSLSNLRVIARALDVEIHSDAGRMGLLSTQVIERLGSAILAAICGDLKLPEIHIYASRLSTKYRTVPFNLPKPANVAEPVSKAVKKEKGKQLAKEIATARKGTAPAGLLANIKGADDRQKQLADDRQKQLNDTGDAAANKGSAPADAADPAIAELLNTSKKKSAPQAEAVAG